jgi:hypothetical protein
MVDNLFEFAIGPAGCGSVVKGLSYIFN